MGKYAEPSIDEHTARDHVERVFQVRTRAFLTRNTRQHSADIYCGRPPYFWPF